MNNDKQNDSGSHANPDLLKGSSVDCAPANRIISSLMILLVFIIAGIYLSRPLYDPDFYWHLKTGQWIWQNKALPHIDPFGVPPLPASSPRTDFILTSYWLFQLILYAFYSLGGMAGIIVFRWVVALISLLTFTRWTNVRDSNVIAVIILGAIQLLEFYFIGRPQFISFVCFGILLVILFRYFDQRIESSLLNTLVPLSVLMVVWANMHGGFLIGQAILIYCVIAEGIKLFHYSLGPLSAQKYRILLISSIAALIASFVNPNAINLIKYLPIIFDSDYYVNVNNLEMLSIFEYFERSRQYFVFLYIASIVLTFCVVFLSNQRKNITWIGILAGTAFMGCQHMRLFPFFLVAAMIFITKYFETETSAIKGRFILIFMLIFTTIYGVSDEFPRILESVKSGWVPIYQYPVKAADFVTKNNINGNMYTTMEWGGYMIWRVGPESKIFYDGRTLDVQRAWEYDNSRIIAVNQRSYWKGLFNAYNIGTAILPIYENDGNPSTLTLSMYADNDWEMVYADDKEAVFVKN